MKRATKGAQDTPQTRKTFVATTMASLEPVLAKELESLGAKEVTPHNRAVSFAGNKRLLYNANVWLRTALRILIPIRKFSAADQHQLYAGCRKVDWEKYLDVNGTLAVDSAVYTTNFNHSKFVALKVKDAIVDQFRDRHGVRPNVDTANPDLRIHIHMRDD